MGRSAISENTRSFLSVVAGVLTAIAVGALLIPLTSLAIGGFSRLDFISKMPATAWKNDLPVYCSLFCWFFLSSLAGGFVCTILSISRETIHVLISSLVTIGIVLLLSGDIAVREGFLLPSLLIMLGIPLGNLAGAGIGGWFKRRRKVHRS